MIIPCIALKKIASFVCSSVLAMASIGDLSSVWWRITRKLISSHALFQVSEFLKHVGRSWILNIFLYHLCFFLISVFSFPLYHDLDKLLMSFISSHAYSFSCVSESWCGTTYFPRLQPGKHCLSVMNWSENCLHFSLNRLSFVDFQRKIFCFIGMDLSDFVLELTQTLSPSPGMVKREFIESGSLVT